MKKLLILALVALVAGSAFAMTDPAFTGDFEFTTQIDFDDTEYIVAASPDASINLNGVVDDYNTVNAEIGTTSVTVDPEVVIAVNGDTTGGAGLIALGDAVQTTKRTVAAVAATDTDLLGKDVGEVVAASSTTAGLWQVNEFTMTTDLTGALGVDGPVAVTLKWGAQTFIADDYSGKAGYGEIEVPNETATYIGIKADITFADMITLVAALVPQSYVPDTWGGAVAKPVLFFEVKASGLVEGLDANVWFISDENSIETQIGLTAGYGSDAFDLGVAFSYAMGLTDDTISGGISGAYHVGALTAGLAFLVSDFTDFVNAAGVGVNVTYSATDMLDIYAAATVPFANIADTLGVEGGVVFALGGTTYTLGYEYNSVNFNAPDNAGFDGLFFKVAASF